jgi:hypothetical protein
MCCSVVLAFASQTFASVVWDESVSGDVSDNPAAPTQINLAAGTNSFVAALNGTDLDFLTIHVPAGTVFSGLFNPVYISDDQVSFIAIGPGTSLPTTVLMDDPTGLLGYTHFGPGALDPSENMLVDMSIAQFGVPGFTQPLPAGTYSFWIQQASNIDESYQLDFKVDAVPEPASGLLLVVGCVCGVVGRVRHR